MTESGGNGESPALRQAQQEIERLRRRLADERYADDLREALTQASVAGTIAAPVTHARLLEMIVETAAHVISAQAASLFLIDPETEELVFEVALGQKAEEVKKFRVPLGHGIAGLVAVSGQPMAISDASSDPRQATDIAQSIGYKPQSILCVPLFFDEQVIGVLELLDKQGATSFSPEDMEALWMFANLAAVAIEQSLTNHNLAALVGQIVESMQELPGYQRESLREQGKTFAANLEGERQFERAVDLARLVAEIAQHGDAAATACRSVLSAFAEYIRATQANHNDFDIAL